MVTCLFDVPVLIGCAVGRRPFQEVREELVDGLTLVLAQQDGGLEHTDVGIVQEESKGIAAFTYEVQVLRRVRQVVALAKQVVVHLVGRLFAYDMHLPTLAVLLVAEDEGLGSGQLVFGDTAVIDQLRT